MAKMRGFRGAEIGKRVKKVVEETNLGDRMGMEIRALSKGYRQRVGLAQALIHEPPILILDEPMSGLDPNQATGVRDLIREIGRDRTVILSTHNLAEVQVTCGRVLIISGGVIVADDTPDHLSARAGKGRFVATVRAEGDDLGAVQRTLEKVPGAASVVQKVGDADGEIRFELVPKSDEDLRADIFRAAVEGGFVLLGLEKHGEDLESIFRDLTTGPEADKEAKAA
jgi:ABC-2 type transport system ATP-binding protein